MGCEGSARREGRADDIGRLGERRPRRRERARALRLDGRRREVRVRRAKALRAGGALLDVHPAQRVGKEVLVMIMMTQKRTQRK